MDPIHAGRGYEKLSCILKQKNKRPKIMAEQIKDPVSNSYAKKHATKIVLMQLVCNKDKKYHSIITYMYNTVQNH